MDAFTDTAFKGNPAAVCWLEEIEKDDKWLQSVATEFNLSETCYLTPIVDQGSENPRFHLRWFTPVAEVITSLNFYIRSPLFICLCRLPFVHLGEFGRTSVRTFAKQNFICVLADKAKISVLPFINLSLFYSDF